MKKMVIITGYFSGDSHGLLGPQMAASIISRQSECTCIVVATHREESKKQLASALDAYFEGQRPLIGFSAIGGRDDLVAFARHLRGKGAVTVLGGPQSSADFQGEVGWKDHPHRFKGFSDAFTFAIHGPAEQFTGIPDADLEEGGRALQGAVYREADGTFTSNPEMGWKRATFGLVDWKNIYRIHHGKLIPLTISSGQVLQQVGCPHAAKNKIVEIDYPSFMPGAAEKSIRMDAKGCSFCDVAVDKGFHGALDTETVLDQIECLPEGKDGRKIPFELINENPLFGLPKLMAGIFERNLAISQINLTMRADWMLKGEKYLRQALATAEKKDVRILLTSMGFESFDPDILKNLNKGVTVADNLNAVNLLRRLKKDYRNHWGYMRTEGGNHGLIHPTPWDTEERALRFERLASRFRLPVDILPPNSTPLIIHHASCLGEWIREIEKREHVRFERVGSVIGWWQIGDRFFL